MIVSISVLRLSAAGADEAGLSEDLRDLTAAHAGMIAGDLSQVGKQASVLNTMAPKIDALAGSESQTSDKDVRAIVSYLLSGGAPEPVISVITAGKIPKNFDRLVRGVLAYAIGRRDAAADLLAPVSPQTLDLSIAGEVAFAKSVLEPPDKSIKAIEDLDLARLLDPGDLVEEAAIRREIGLLAKAKQLEKFELIVRQYFSRFTQSIYAREFTRRLATLLMYGDLIQDESTLTEITPTLAQYPSEERARILTDIARSGLLHGKLSVAVAAASQALQEKAISDTDKNRSRFYKDAGGLLMSSYDASLVDLDQIDIGKLNLADRRLYSATQDASKKVRQFPDVTEAMLISKQTPSSTISLGDKAVSDAEAVIAEK